MLRRKLYIFFCLLFLIMTFSKGSAIFAKSNYSFNDGVLTIYNDDFWDFEDVYEKEDIRSVIFVDGVSYIPERAFSDCSGLQEIVFSDSINYISAYAFQNCTSLKSFYAPNNLLTIEKGAFADCTNLEEIFISKSVESIEDFAFLRCGKLKSIVVDADNRFYDSRNNCNALINTTDNSLVLGCANTIIPNSITDINDCAFSECSLLINIAIPEGVSSIGYDAFESCISLESVSFPSTLTIIQGGAFHYCINLKSISIGDNVSYIDFEEGAFSYCISLEKITVSSGNNSYDSRDECNAIIDSKKNCLEIGCKNTVIPKGIKTIGCRAFSGCSDLNVLIIPDGVQKIEEGAFAECINLYKIFVPSSVIEIVDAFLGEDDNNDELYVLPNLTVYGENGSYAQTYAIENKIPFVATTVHDFLAGFSQNNSGSSENSNVSQSEKSSNIILDNNTVVDVEENKDNNNSLSGTNVSTETDITSPEMLSDTSTTYNTKKVGTLFTLGKKIYKITKTGENGGTVAFIRTTSKKVTTVSVPATIKVDGITYKVTSISASALAKNTKLKSVTIGKNVKTIGKKAFYGCKNLKKITIKSSSLKSVGKNALKGIHAKAVIKVQKQKLKVYKRLLKGKGQGKDVSIK